MSKILQYLKKPVVLLALALVLVVVMIFAYFLVTAGNNRHAIYIGNNAQVEGGELLEAVQEYKKNYTPFQAKQGKPISVTVDFDVKATAVSLVAPANDDTPTEMSDALALLVETQKDGRTVKIDTEWGYLGNREHTLYALVLRVVDTADNMHYYYLRVNFAD